MRQWQAMLRFFNAPWHEVPTVWIDTETTGTQAGYDRAVQVGFARFERGECVNLFSRLVSPGIPIPAEATAIHGITNEMVAGAPPISEVFQSREAVEIVSDAQPAAFNAPFDRHFVPPFGPDWTWPWLDGLSFVRKCDRYEPGKGRHKLSIACSRHGVDLPKAHDAGADAKAAGELFYALASKMVPEGYTLGQLLFWQRRMETAEWFRFNEWVSAQPPMPDDQIVGRAEDGKAPTPKA